MMGEGKKESRRRKARKARSYLTRCDRARDVTLRPRPEVAERVHKLALGLLQLSPPSSGCISAVIWHLESISASLPATYRYPAC